MASEFAEATGDRTRRDRRRKRLAAVAALVVVGAVVLSARGSLLPRAQTQPMLSPTPNLSQNVVWYDAAGLHHGDTLEATAVPLMALQGKAIVDGALALVHSGAVYLDPQTGDVWFQPWGGEPHIVGRNSITGPSADPNGDIAAWQENLDQLVIYDTAGGQVIDRIRVPGLIQLPYDSNTCHGGCQEQDEPGNGFLQVSGIRVTWTASQGHDLAYSYNLDTGEVALLDTPALPKLEGVYDVHDREMAYAVRSSNIWGWNLLLDTPSSPARNYPTVNPRSRFSPSGNYLAVYATITDRGQEAAAIIDTNTGEVWRPPKTNWSWVAWSYGDTALLATGDQLQACDPLHRICQSLPAQAPFLMPTN